MKKDEIIYATMKLFFENGYDATFVRMILNKVGGEMVYAISATIHSESFSKMSIFEKTSS